MAAEHQSGGHRSADDVEVGRTGARFGGSAGRRRRAEPVIDEGATSRHRGDRPSVGEAGSRMPTLRKRWRQEQQEPVLVESTPVPHPQATSAEVEPSCAGGAEWVEVSDWEAVRDRDGLVRPYFWTGGRTASRFELAFETLLSGTGQPIDPTSPPEHHRILTLCAAPRSVAELAALLSMPLGVARVVLGDMAEAGSVAVHRTAGSADSAPDLELMQRVLNGLQRL